MPRPAGAGLGLALDLGLALALAPVCKGSSYLPDSDNVGTDASLQTTRVPHPKVLINVVSYSVGSLVFRRNLPK